MTKTEKELKKEFSAYVKTAIKNTQKQYLIKKGKILDNEIAMDDEGIDEILQKQTEDLFDKMRMNWRNVEFQPKHGNKQARWNCRISGK